MIGFFLFGVGGIAAAFLGREYGFSWATGSVDFDWLTSPLERFKKRSASKPPPRPKLPARTTLQKLATYEPNFSLVLFEDFLQALYARTQDARGRGKLEKELSAWLRLMPTTELGKVRNVTAVKGVVIGAVRLLDADIDEAVSRATVTVEFESSFTEEVTEEQRSKERTVWAVEHWKLSRSCRAQSRAPDEIHVFRCPRCGGPAEDVHAGACPYCHETVCSGDYDWVVDEVTIVQREERPPQLLGEVEEVGTDSPTKVDPEAIRMLRELSARDPVFTFTGFQARVELVFSELQIAWSEHDRKRMRPFVSSALFEGHSYWMETYRRSKLRNITQNARISLIQVAAVRSDKFFDSITVRVFATGLDYTISTETGELLCGSKQKERRYSEYWTFIRSVSRGGKATADRRCPHCGGELSVNMAGNCEYCQALVTTGDFDWVLSRIEQDEAYAG
jgi:predicted lipid-binding transport protein (Tim44 family)